MRKAMKILASSAVAMLFAAALSTVCAQTSLKLGVFDPQRVSEETAEGKRIQASLAEIRDVQQRPGVPAGEAA